MSGALLELRAVRLSYGARVVLHSIDLTVEPGDRICLLGPNGAGKSSLLRCVTGLARPDGGTVLLDGVPVEEMSRSSLARRVAVVPGDVRLPFAMRVEEVVALGRLPYEHPLLGGAAADQAAVIGAMRRTGVEHLTGRDARELSLGERQLVVLALAVAQTGGLLVLDEPTVHLDLGHQVAVMALLRDLSEQEGLTIVTVLHDLSLAAQSFPRLVLMDSGRIVADGTPEDVLTADRIRDVYGVAPRYVALPTASK